MLILTRRLDERIFIGDDVVICVLGIENNRVKLGIDAPQSIPILREEIHSSYIDGGSDSLPVDEVDELRNRA